MVIAEDTVSKMEGIEERVRNLLGEMPVDFPFIPYESLVDEYYTELQNHIQLIHAKVPEDIELRVTELVNHLAVEDLDNYARQYQQELRAIGLVAVPKLKEFLSTEGEEKEHRQGVLYPCGSNYDYAGKVLGLIIEDNMKAISEKYDRAKKLWFVIRATELLK
ncbi:hypothetical protein COV16_07395 [Candidatus Woesearchaeota archaeon CG10_big_fil_rev_8_21_14_0_10_34_8]|nr:MAG: hypothetical protein COV16_07395 [Candidatus Woesearchaeota archaeon CG10_big_fil_rev_8_21_14_0_10_34_8]